MKKTMNRLLALALAVCITVATAPAALAAPGDNAKDTGVHTSDSGFIIQVTDMENQVHEYIQVPDGMRLHIVDEDKNPIDTTLYQVDWCYLVGKGEEKETKIYKANTPVLELPATTIFMLNFPLFPVIKDQQTKEEVARLQPPMGILVEPDTSYLIINNQAVLPGESHEGVALSQDGKIVTMDNVELAYMGDDLWGTPPVLMDLLGENAKIQVNGTNTISSQYTTAMQVVRDHKLDFERSSCIMEGGSLTLSTNAENALLAGTGQEGKEGFFTDLTIRGMALDLSAQTNEDGEYADSALRLQKGTLRIENCTLKAISDFVNTIELATIGMGADPSGLEVVNSELNIVNNTTIRQREDVPTETRLIAVFVGGDNAMLLDNSTLNIELKTRTTEQIIGVGSINANTPTRIINGSKVSVVLKNPEATDDFANSLVCGLASGGFDIQNSTVDVDVEGTPYRGAVVWGFTYGLNKFEASNNAKITVNANGKFSEGIRYYYAVEEGAALTGQFGDLFPSESGPSENSGIVNIFDANVNLNVFSTTTTTLDGRPAGISGRFLNVGFTRPKYGLNVNTTAELGNSDALLFSKYVGTENIGYTPGYTSERIRLGSNTKFLSPVPAEINMFSYLEGGGNKYLQSEVVYSKDTTKPVSSVKIGYAGGSSSGGGSGPKSPVTFNYDAPTNDVVNGKVDVNKLSLEALEAVKAGKTSLLVRNADEISPEAFQKVYAASKTMAIYADTTVNGATTIRLKLASAAGRTLPQSIRLGGSLTAEATKERFAKYFTNELAVVRLNQNGTYGMPVGVAARVDLGKLNAKSLYFYAYNRETNKYYQVQTKYAVDANGFLHFTTTLAGDILITDKPLAHKA